MTLVFMATGSGAWLAGWLLRDVVCAAGRRVGAAAGRREDQGSADQ